MFYPVYLTVRVDIQANDLEQAKKVANKLSFDITTKRYDDILVGIESLGIDVVQQARLYSKTDLESIGRRDYKELCIIFNGRPFESIDNIVDALGLAYGALCPDDGEDMVDVDYKSICATIENKNGVCKVNPRYEVWDDHTSKWELAN